MHQVYALTGQAELNCPMSNLFSQYHFAAIMNTSVVQNVDLNFFNGASLVFADFWRCITSAVWTCEIGD